MKPSGTYPFTALEPFLEERLPAYVDAHGQQIPAASGPRVAALLGVNRRTIVRWRGGQLLNQWNADQAAIRCGTHPAVVWPAWQDDALLEAV